MRIARITNSPCFNGASNGKKETFLEKLYNGSTNKLLLNFVEEKKISKKDLQDLLDLIESED